MSGPEYPCANIWQEDETVFSVWSLMITTRITLVC